MWYNILYFLIFAYIQCENDVCYIDEKSKLPTCTNPEDNVRYIMYEVNPSEGFNLRRDVYMRFALMTKAFRDSPNPRLNNFKLLLPPWSHLYHWHSSHAGEYIPWSYYFDLPSLQRFAPVLEMYQYFETLPKTDTVVSIDEVYILRHFEDMFHTGKFLNKMELTSCDFEHITYFHYTNFTAKSIQCLLFHGPASYLKQLLLNSTAKTILFVQAEVVLHDKFGDRIYWEARRSMRFNKDLRAVAAHYRYKYLSSSDEPDKTFFAPNWQDDTPRRTAIGGPYLGVHMRRKDFFFGRPKELPTLDKVAHQIMAKLKELDLSVVYLATDAPASDIMALKHMLSDNVIVAQFWPDNRFVDLYKDGGKAIVEQIICSHARYFIGTYESTFTYRIQEEREILGFPIETTFNALCPNEKNCKKPTVWKIVY